MNCEDIRQKSKNIRILIDLANELEKKEVYSNDDKEMAEQKLNYLRKRILALSVELHDMLNVMEHSLMN